MDGRTWWQGADLNRRPKAYESSALPLSYTAWVLQGQMPRQEAKSVTVNRIFVQRKLKKTCVVSSGRLSVLVPNAFDLKQFPRSLSLHFPEPERATDAAALKQAPCFGGHAKAADRSLGLDP